MSHTSVVYVDFYPLIFHSDGLKNRVCDGVFTVSLVESRELITRTLLRTFP